MKPLTGKVPALAGTIFLRASEPARVYVTPESAWKVDRFAERDAKAERETKAERDAKAERETKIEREAK